MSGAGSTVAGAAKFLLRLTPSGDAARIWLPTAMMSVVLAFASFTTQGPPQFVHWLLAINVFYGLFLVLTWGAMWSSTPEDVREWALAQQPPRLSRWARALEVILDKRVFSGGAGMSLIISSSIVGLSLALALLPQGRGLDEEPMQALLCVLGVLMAWTMLHTSYAMYYAHLYYRVPGKPGGMEFPGEVEPGALDFCYFAFAVGTAFAVSDVAVSSTGVRRTVLLHSILAFFYNTAILALVINFIVVSV